MMSMKISSDNNSYINRILPSKQIQQSGNSNIAQSEKTRDIASLLSNTTPTSKNTNAQQVIYNNVNASSMLQVANDSLEEIRGGLEELKSLSMRAISTPSSNLSSLQNHAADIVAGIQDLLESTKFSGEYLLTENASHTITTNDEVKNAIRIITYDVENELKLSGLHTLDITNPESINRSLQSIDDSMDIINLISADYYAQQRAFNQNIGDVFADMNSNSMLQSTEAQAVSSQIMQNIQGHAPSSIQAQANVNNERTLNLLTR